MRSPQLNDSQPQTQPQSKDVVDSPPVECVSSQNQLSQRWFSAEALNMFEINEEPIPSHPLINLRMRSESESNLDDWEKMEVNEIAGKPPLQPTKGRKKTKAKTNPSSGTPVRKTRAAALKARAKCKEESFPEEY